MDFLINKIPLPDDFPQKNANINPFLENPIIRISQLDAICRQICFIKREFQIFVFVVIITILESVHSKLISCESV